MRPLAAALVLAALAAAAPAHAAEVRRLTGTGEALTLALGPRGHLGLLIRPDVGRFEEPAPYFSLAAAGPGRLPRAARRVPRSRFRDSGDRHQDEPALAVDGRGGVIAVWPSSDRTSTSFSDPGEFVDFCCDRAVAAIREASGRWHRPRTLSRRRRMVEALHAAALPGGRKAAGWAFDRGRSGEPYAQVAFAGRAGRFSAPRELDVGDPGAVAGTGFDVFGAHPGGGIGLGWSSADAGRLVAKTDRAGRPGPARALPAPPSGASADRPAVALAPDGTGIAAWVERLGGRRGVEVRYARLGAAGAYGRARVLMRAPTARRLNGPLLGAASGGHAAVAVGDSSRIVALRVPGGRPRRLEPGTRNGLRYYDALLEPAVDSRGRVALAWQRGDAMYVARVR